MIQRLGGPLASMAGIVGSIGDWKDRQAATLELLEQVEQHGTKDQVVLARAARKLDDGYSDTIVAKARAATVNLLLAGSTSGLPGALATIALDATHPGSHRAFSRDGCLEIQDRYLGEIRDQLESNDPARSLCSRALATTLLYREHEAECSNPAAILKGQLALGAVAHPEGWRDLAEVIETAMPKQEFLGEGEVSRMALETLNQRVEGRHHSMLRKAIEIDRLVAHHAGLAALQEAPDSQTPSLEAAGQALEYRDGAAVSAQFLEHSLRFDDLDDTQRAKIAEVLSGDCSFSSIYEGLFKDHC